MSDYRNSRRTYTNKIQGVELGEEYLDIDYDYLEKLTNHAFTKQAFIIAGADKVILDCKYNDVTKHKMVTVTVFDYHWVRILQYTEILVRGKIEFTIDNVYLPDGFKIQVEKV